MPASSCDFRSKPTLLSPVSGGAYTPELAIVTVVEGITLAVDTAGDIVLAIVAVEGVALAVVAVEGVVLAIVAAVEGVSLAVVAVEGVAVEGVVLAKVSVEGDAATAAATIVLLGEDADGRFDLDAWTMPHRSQPLSSLRKVAADSQSPHHLYFTCCASTTQAIWYVVRNKREILALPDRVKNKYAGPASVTKQQECCFGLDFLFYFGNGCLLD